MRYIVVTLLIVNLAYFSWHLYFPSIALPADSAISRPLLNQGLVLLSEFNEQAPEIGVVEAAPSKLCYLVGDFNSIDEANNFINHVEIRGYLAELNPEGENSPPQYRAYLSPATNRELATITLDRLRGQLAAQSLQVETYLITRGSLENAVALGVYSEMAETVRISSQLAGLGYNVKVEEIPMTSGPYQLVLAKVDFSTLDIAEWLEFAGDRPDLTYSENLCEVIAQGIQFP